MKGSKHWDFLTYLHFAGVQLAKFMVHRLCSRGNSSPAVHGLSKPTRKETRPVIELTFLDVTLPQLSPYSVTPGRAATIGCRKEMLSVCLFQGYSRLSVNAFRQPACAKIDSWWLTAHLTQVTPQSHLCELVPGVATDGIHRRGQPRCHGWIGSVSSPSTRHTVSLWELQNHWVGKFLHPQKWIIVVYSSQMQSNDIHICALGTYLTYLDLQCFEFFIVYWIWKQVHIYSVVKLQTSCRSWFPGFSKPHLEVTALPPSLVWTILFTSVCIHPGWPWKFHRRPGRLSHSLHAASRG
jgi:hypothetical protein